MNTIDVCGSCGYQFDVREGRLDFPHPLYPTFVCGSCIKEEELELANRNLEDEYADGLISEYAYTVRKAELQKIGE